LFLNSGAGKSTEEKKKINFDVAGLSDRGKLGAKEKEKASCEKKTTRVGGGEETWR